MHRDNVTQDRGELLARGRTAEVYAWSENQVLKLFFDWCPPEWIQREVRVGRTLASTGLPTPKLLDTISLDGRQGIIFARVEGHSMLSELGTTPWLLASRAHQLAKLHSAIHHQNAPDLPPLRLQLKTAITQAEGLPSDLSRHALSILADLPDGEALCHFDFHPDQVLVTRQGPAILDWMTAAKGNPLADVAKTCVLIRFAQAPYASWVMRAATNIVRRAFHDRYLAAYMRLRPEANLNELQRWMVPVAAARIGENVPGERDRLLVFLGAPLK